MKSKTRMMDRYTTRNVVVLSICFIEHVFFMDDFMILLRILKWRFWINENGWLPKVLAAACVQNEGILIVSCRCTEWRHTSYQQHMYRMKAYQLSTAYEVCTEWRYTDYQQQMYRMKVQRLSTTWIENECILIINSICAEWRHTDYQHQMTYVQNEGVLIINSRCTEWKHRGYQQHICRLHTDFQNRHWNTNHWSE
jgi:hypothetical protein